jgi:hypothetical protein
MPKYLVKEKSLIGNTLHEAGETVEYDGLPAENLEPLCDEGRAKYQEYLKTNADRVAKLKEQFSESGVGDPAKFAATFAAELKKANDEFVASIPGMIAAAVAQAMATAFPKGIAVEAAPAAPAGATDATNTNTNTADTGAADAAAKPAGKTKSS